jgi:hypothetical protein
VNERLSAISNVKTVSVVGEDDKLMPSKQEPERLSKKISHLEKLVANGRGYFVLDENVKLTEAILYSNIDPLGWKEDNGKNKKKLYDPITDWKLPDDVYKYIDERIQPFRDTFSPVSVSTNTSRERLGISPRRRVT